jgi:hypothetical protein
VNVAVVAQRDDQIIALHARGVDSRRGTDVERPRVPCAGYVGQRSLSPRDRRRARRAAGGPTTRCNAHGASSSARRSRRCSGATRWRRHRGPWSRSGMRSGAHHGHEAAEGDDERVPSRRAVRRCRTTQTTVCTPSGNRRRRRARRRAWAIVRAISAAEHRLVLVSIRTLARQASGRGDRGRLPGRGTLWWTCQPSRDLSALEDVMGCSRDEARAPFEAEDPRVLEATQFRTISEPAPPLIVKSSVVV